MIVGSSQLWRKISLCRFFETELSLLTLTFCSPFSVEFSFFIFVLSQLISDQLTNTKNLYSSIQIANTSAFRDKQTDRIYEVRF
jgi:hypothetical protein